MPRIPVFHSSIVAIADTTNCLIFLGLTFLIWKYYSSLPVARMTVMTYLMKDFIVCIAVSRTMQFVKIWTVTIFTSSTTTAAKEMS